jgi:hypothetical protein
MIRNAMLADTPGCAAPRAERTPRRAAPVYPAGLCLRICALLLASCPLRALALDGGAVPAAPAAPGVSAKQAARAHFEAGVEHYRARRYRDAIRELKVSFSLVPNPEIWFNVGRAHEQLGELQLAIDHYRGYLSHLPGARDTADLAEHIEVLERRVAASRSSSERPEAPQDATLVLELSARGVAVEIDGEPVDVEHGGRVLAVAPGARAVDAELAGHVPFLARVDVEPSSLRAAYVELAPLSGVDTGAGSSPSWTATAIGAGATGVALLTFGGLALAGVAARDDGDVATSADLERGATIALGAALAFALTTVVVHVATAPSD